MKDLSKKPWNWFYWLHKKFCEIPIKCAVSDFQVAFDKSTFVGKFIYHKLIERNIDWNLTLDDFGKLTQIIDSAYSEVRVVPTIHFLIRLKMLWIIKALKIFKKK